jgi:splicing factor U2AF subunit
VPQDEEVLQVHFEEFYEDIFEELTNIGGELEQLRVCENLSDHLTGNVYAKFCEEEDAERALKALTVRSPTTAARASRRRRSTMLAGC